MYIIKNLGYIYIYGYFVIGYTGGSNPPSPLKQKIIELISQNKYITTLELAESLNRSRSAIAKQIAKLKEDGVIERIGPDKGGYWGIKK